MLSLQEMFDTQAEFTFEQAQLLGSINQMWFKYASMESNPENTRAYHFELKEIADKYRLDYRLPTHMGVVEAVKGVGSPATLH